MFWLYFGLGLPVVLGLAGVIIGFVVGIEGGVLSGLGIGAGVGFIGALIGFLLGIVPLTYAQTHFNERTLTCKVTEKDRGGEDDDMRVYTSCGTFINADSTWRGKHNSADLWAKIHEGETYQFDVAGWRLGFTSDFPNIFKVSEVNQ
jgi:hypothetical protein